MRALKKNPTAVKSVMNGFDLLSSSSSGDETSDKRRSYAGSHYSGVTV